MKTNYEKLMKINYEKLLIFYLPFTAFSACSGFTGSLTIGNSVTTIGNYAFSACSGFTGSLDIPNSVTTIGAGAFRNCSGFTGDLVIPNSVVTIVGPPYNGQSNQGAFYGCTGFTSLTIGTSVTSIGRYAFYGCSGLTGDLTIPNSVTTIEDGAFYNCSVFTGSLTIPNSVTTIGNNAFQGCSFNGLDINMTTVGSYFSNTNFTGSLTIGNSVTTIGNGAFSGCSGFTGSLDIPNSVTTIGHSAFRNCSGFTGDLIIPNSVITIQGYSYIGSYGAFAGCSGFTGNLTIGNSVTTIENFAFAGCSGFTGSLTIGNSVTTIGGYAFYNCSGLTGDLTIPNSVETIEEGAFCNCSGFTGNLIIPNTVITIESPSYNGYGAFQGCIGFTGRLTIGNSMATIGAKAFYNCSGFTEIRTEAETPPSISSNTFYNVNLGIPLYVPCGSQEAYEGANVWRNFTNMKDMCPHVIYAIIVPAGAGVVTGAGTYPHDSIATLVATPNPGYVFFNWTLDGQQVTLDTVCSLVSLEDTNIEAHFTDNPVYIDITATTDPVGGGIISGDGVYLQGQIATLSVAPDENFVFLNWTKDGEVVSTETSFDFLVTEDEQYVAHFNPIHQVTVVAVPAEGGTVTGEGRYEQGTSCTLSASVNTGYDFQCWTKEYGPVINSNLSYTFTVTEPATYEAHFAEAENVVIGTDTTANSYLPSYSNFNYSLTQQIYTADELSDVESIGSLSFYNEGETKTRNYTIYMVHTEKALFTSNTDWITVGASNKVYSGSVTMTEGTWTTITLQTPFYYDGTRNIALVVDDNTGSSSSGMSCRVFNANGSQSIRIYSDGTNYSPNSPWNYTGTRLYVKNCIMLGAAPGANMQTYTISATAVPAVAGTVEGGGTYLANTTAMLTATPNEYGTFINWTKDGEEVSTEATIYPTVTEDASYVANFELNSYEITATANLGAGGTVDGAGVYYHFDTCTLTATANVGYTFINWTKDGEEVSTEAIYSFEVTSEAAFVANFELNSYDIEATANPELGGMVEGAGVYYHFDTCTLAATVNEGYHFINWTKNGEEVTTDLTYSFTVTEAASYVANFGQNTFDITATANPLEGGVVDGAGTYGYGATCTLTATANTGYHFVNWTKDGEVVSTEAVYSFTGTVSGDYVANFELNSYEIAATTNLEESGTVTGAGVYNHFDTCTLTAAPNVGYHFLNWTMNGEVVSTESTYSFEVTGAASYVANFELTNYIVSVSVAPTEGGTVSGSGSFTYGQSCTLEALPNPGYSFNYWSKDGITVSYNSTYSFTVVGDCEFVAHFTRNSYYINVTVNPNGAGYVMGTGSFNYGASCTLTATANVGYHFVNWTKDGEEVSTSTTYSFTVTETGDYVANFELNTYEITATANPEAGGTVTGAGTYSYGETATLTATANEDYSFLGWTENGEIVSTEAVCSFTVTGSRSLVANFELNNITQTTNFNNGWNWWSGYVELDENSLEQLQEGLGSNGLTIKSQNDGYASYLEGFGWYGSLNSINNQSTYQVKTNTACTMEMTGSAANPEDHPITLNSGWTWVGYPVNLSMSVAEALSGITPQNGDMLKSQNDGFASYLDGFGWYGSLSILNPGMGLMFKSNNSSAVTFVYPNGGTRTDLKANQTAENNHWSPNLTAYPDNMSVMAVVELDGNELQGENYELAAFANGEVRGSARLMYVEPLNRYMAFLTIAGDEAVELHFGLYNNETGAVETQCVASLPYETNAVVGSFAEPYVVRFRGTTGIDEWVSSVNVFPNPVEHGQTVSLGIDVAETGEVLVEIINALGAVVETVHAPSVQTITAPSTIGVYTLKISVERNGTCYRRLVVR